MTHGDKAKAKAGKTSQASGKKSSSPAGGVQGKTGENGKGTVKAAATKGSKAGGSSESFKKGSAAEKAAATKGSTGSSSAKEPAPAKGRGPAPEAGGFSNPVIADAFKRALKKYPNALRKLTD